MASPNMNTTTQQVQVSERRNAEAGVQETIVETVDYRSYPGQDPQQQGQLRRENIQVIHQLHPQHQQQQVDSASSGASGVLRGAAAVVANTIQLAKDAISGTGTTTTTTTDALPISQGQTN